MEIWLKNKLAKINPAGVTSRLKGLVQIISLLLFILMFGNSIGFAGTVLAENGPHVTFNAIPFASSSGPGTGEYQEIYSASLFGGPVDLLSFAFSPGTTELYSANVTLLLTTTTVGVGSLSANLATNFVTPLTTVFSDPTFSQNVTGGSESFSLIFNLTTPFLYDPAAGNLLLDVLISDQVSGGIGFTRSDGGSILSRAYDVPSYGNGADGVGLRTTIGFATTAPEPGTIFLTLIGLVIVAVVSGKRLSSGPCASKRLSCLQKSDF